MSYGSNTPIGNTSNEQLVKNIVKLLEKIEDGSISILDTIRSKEMELRRVDLCSKNREANKRRAEYIRKELTILHILKEE